MTDLQAAQEAVDVPCRPRTAACPFRLSIVIGHSGIERKRPPPMQDEGRFTVRADQVSDEAHVATPGAMRS